MALDNFLGSDTLTLLVMLAVFLIVGYKVLDVLKNVIIIAVLSAVFPHLLNRFFGASFVTSLNAEMTYVIAGVGMYIMYEILVIGLEAGGIVWSILELAAKPFVWVYEGIKELLGGLMNATKGKEKTGSKRADEEEPVKKGNKRNRGAGKSDDVDNSV